MWGSRGHGLLSVAAFRRGARPSRTSVVIASTLFGALLASGLVVASASPDVIYACRNKGSGVLRWVEGPNKCVGSEVELSWNQEGAAGRNGEDGNDGAMGPAGPAGPPGAEGPAGPAGADGRDGRDGTGLAAGSPCNVGTPEEGVLIIDQTTEYEQQDVYERFALRCRRSNTDQLLNLKLVGTNRDVDQETWGATAVSEPEGLNCSIEPTDQLRAVVRECEARMNFRSNAVIIVTPEEGARVRWTGCDLSEDNRCLVNMSSPRSVTARVE